MNVYKKVNSGNYGRKVFVVGPLRGKLDQQGKNIYVYLFLFKPLYALCGLKDLYIYLHLVNIIPNR